MCTQLAAVVAVVKMEPVAQLLLAASLVLVEKEIIKVVLHQVAVHQVAVVLLHQRIHRQRILHQNQKHAYRASVWETQDITQRAVIITAMMDHLDALVQIHTNVEAAPQVDTHKFFFFFFFFDFILIYYSLKSHNQVRSLKFRKVWSIFAKF
jgi:hypothetical protein